MRMRFWIVAVVAVVLAQSTVTKNIAGQTGQFNLSPYSYRTHLRLGLSAVDCGQMTSLIRLDRRSGEMDFSNHIQGFMTGVNFHARLVEKGNPLVGKGTSRQAMFAAVEQYCVQNPLESVSTAIESVYLQLAER